MLRLILLRQTNNESNNCREYLRKELVRFREAIVFNYYLHSDNIKFTVRGRVKAARISGISWKLSTKFVQTRKLRVTIIVQSRENILL